LTSWYFFDHHRFETVTVTLLEQDGTQLRVRAELSALEANL